MRRVGGDGMFWGIAWVAAEALVPKRASPSETCLAGEGKVGARENQWAPSLGDGTLKVTQDSDSSRQPGGNILLLPRTRLWKGRQE